MSQSKLEDGKKRWLITVIYMKKTTTVLQEHIKSKLTSALNSWPQQALNNFDEFISKVNEQDGYVYYEKPKDGGRGTWKIQDNDETNNLILSKILDLHTNPYFRNIQFQSNDSWMGSMPERYWKLAKIFMPYGNNRSREPADSDSISFFDLLRNCRCFSGDFDRQSLDTLCEARYSVSTRSYLEVTELDRFVKAMESLLSAPILQLQVKVVQLIQELNNLDSPTLSITSIDLDTVRKIASDYNLNPSEFDEVQLQEGLNDLKMFLQSDEMKATIKNIEMMTKQIDENTSKEDRYKKIGGWTGASIVGGMTGTVVGTGAVLAFAPVSVPAICVTALVTGTISSGMGYLGFAGGQEGGSVIARLRRILN